MLAPMMELPAVFHPDHLPAPDEDAKAHGQQVVRQLRADIQAAGGWMSFEDWMQQALYAPGLGYYSAGSRKLDRQGDFTTAPEISPLFGQALARQVAQVLQACGSTRVLEFGAGSGALAASVIPALEALGHAVDYEILEISPDLRERQSARLSPLNHAVRWVETLPTHFEGCVIANEVLDAMPVRLVRRAAGGRMEELGVSLDGRPEAACAFRWAARPAATPLAEYAAARVPPLSGYRTELNLQAEAWVRHLGQWLHRGAALLVDYGFPRAEYYHPQRVQGTLMCHFRHHAHDQALILAGLQDITAHVDFTAIADAALEGGLEVMGYTSQARFLMNAGLMDLIPAADHHDATQRARQLTALNTLLSEAEMGELFKVMAIGRGLEVPLMGFSRGDRRDRLSP